MIPFIPDSNIPPSNPRHSLQHNKIFIVVILSQQQGTKQIKINILPLDAPKGKSPLKNDIAPLAFPDEAGLGC